MIKDIFVLKRTAWYSRQMRWIWGYEPDDFKNMCPFFWLSVLNTIIIIPFSILKGTVLLIGAIGNAIGEMGNERRERWYKEYTESIKMGDKKSIWELYDKWQHSSWDYKGSDKDKYWRLREWLDSLTPDEKQHYWNTFWDMKQKQLEEDKQYEAKKRAKALEKAKKIAARNAKRKPRKPKSIKSRQQRIGELTIKIKKVAKVIGVLVIIGLIYATYLGVVWMTTLDWTSIGWTALEVFGIIYLIVGGIGACIILYEWFDHLWNVVYDYCLRCERRREKFRKFFSAIGRGLSYLIYLGYIFAVLLPLWWALVWIGKRLFSFWILLMAIKSNNCPGIDWKD
jgi:hypothetical protein